MFKYALFLVVALCAVKGFEARAVQLDDRSLEDVINAIKEILHKIEEDIADITSEIPAYIHFIKTEINEMVDKINLPGIIAAIEGEIEMIIEFEVAGQKCVEAEREQIDDLILNAPAGVDACVATAQPQIVALKDLMYAAVDTANILRTDIYARVVKCVNESRLNPILLYTCLKGQVAPLNEELAKLEQQFKDTVAKFLEMGDQVVKSLASCVERVRDETVAKQNEIISSIYQCVAGSV